MSVGERSRRAAGCWLMLGGLALGLALGEWVLAPRLLPPVGYYIKPPGQSWKSEPGDGVLPGVRGTARLQFTADGLRADPCDAADGYRIVCVGGSTTECLVLDTNEAWPHLLQDRLRTADPARHAWVGGAGMPGGNSRQHILAMRYVLPRLPRCDAVLHLLGFNDLMYRLGADTDYRPLQPEQILTDAPSLELAFQEYPGRRAGLPWFKRTNTWRLGRRAKATWHQLTVQDGLAPMSRLDYGTQLAILQERRRTVMTARQAMPDLTSSLDEFARNLRYLIRQGREQHVRSVFLTQPTLWRVGMADQEKYQLRFAELGRDPFLATECYSAEALTDGMARYNDLIRRVCTEEGAECLDLAALIPKDLGHFYDDCHFNEAGAVKVADELARYLCARPPFAPPAAEGAQREEPRARP